MLHQDLSIIVDGREIDGPIPFFQLAEVTPKIINRGIRNGNGELSGKRLKRFFELYLVVFHVEHLREKNQQGQASSSLSWAKC